MTLHALTQDQFGVTATVEGRNGIENIRALYLVGADGGRSTVRDILGIGFPGEVLGPPLLFGDVEVDGIERDAWNIWPAEGGQLGLCPLPHSSTFQLSVRLQPGETPALDRQSIAALVQNRTGRQDLYVRSVGWLSVFTPNLRLADRYRVGRTFLAGDAAHVHPPMGAQGLNTSIQDAYNLGWKLALALGGGSPALLDTYEAERRPIAAKMLNLSRSLLKQSAERLSRGRETQQLDINYRESSLARQQAMTSQTVTAGDRAPDSPCESNGHATRLFEAFRGTHFTLLLFGDAPQPIGLERWPVRSLRLPARPDGPARFYGVDCDAAVLIRPDNYIAMFDCAPTSRSAAEWFADCIANHGPVQEVRN
jgi:hypothetical protein